MDINIIKSIQELGEIRGLPQFLFMGAVHGESMFRVREEVISFKRNNEGAEEIDFIIHSSGGSPPDAYRIIRTLRSNFDKVNVIIPFWAKSAATLLSLGGTQIIMDEFGEFGPLDIQIGVEKEDGTEIERVSALIDESSVRRIESRAEELYLQMFRNLYSSDEVKINKNELSSQLLEYLASFYKPLLSQINPYNLGKNKRRLDIGETYAKRILAQYNPQLPEMPRDVLVDYLVNRCPDHGYVIDYSLISIFLKNVKLSKELGKEYENSLTNLTTLLLQEYGSNEFFSFIANKEERKSVKSSGDKVSNGMEIDTTTTNK